MGRPISDRVVIFSCLAIGLALLFYYLNTHRLPFSYPSDTSDRNQKSGTIIVSHSPAISPSTEQAKEYIARATLEVKKNNYRQAIVIMDEAIKAFPNDENLKLNRDFYQSEAERYGQ